MNGRGPLHGLAVSAAKGMYRAATSNALRLAGSSPRPGRIIASIIENEPLGISVAGHLMVDSLRAAGFAPHTHGLRPIFDTTHWLRGRFSAHERAGGVWFAHCNAPEALVALMKISPLEWWRLYRIGYWAYELSDAPPSWKRIAHLFHEIWVPSRFVAQSLAGADTRIRVVGHNVGRPEIRVGPSAHFTQGADFVALCAADARSSVFRKNIEGAIILFRKAFPRPSPQRRLVVKVHHTTFCPLAVGHIRESIAGRPDIHVIDRALDATEMASLMASCDVFLSPHRSEGFGLMIAEAFRAGRVALATDWSGNLEFMEGLEPLLIRARAARVRDPYGVYPWASDAQWADPDLDDGAAKLIALERMSVERRHDLAASACARLDAIGSAWTQAALLDLPFARYVARGAPSAGAPHAYAAADSVRPGVVPSRETQEAARVSVLSDMP